MLKQSSSRKLTSPGYFSSQRQAVALDFEEIYQELSGFCGNIIRGFYPTKPSKFIQNAPADEDLVEVRYLDDHLLYIEDVDKGHYLQLDTKQITPLDLNRDYIFPFGGYGVAGQKLNAQTFQFIPGPKSNFSQVKLLEGMDDQMADNGHNLAYIPRNSLILCGMGNKIYFWDLSQEEPLKQDYLECQEKITYLVCNGDDMVAIVQYNSPIVIMEVSTKREVNKLEKINAKSLLFKGDWLCFEDKSNFDQCFPPNISKRLIVINIKQPEQAKVFGVGQKCKDKCLYTNANGTYLIYSESSNDDKVNKVIVIDVQTGYSSSIYLDDKFTEMAKAIIPAHKKSSPVEDNNPCCDLVQATNWGVAIQSDEWVLVVDIEPIDGKHIQSLLPQVQQGQAIFNSIQNGQKVKLEWAMPSSPCRIIPCQNYLLASDGHNLRPVSYFEGDTITNEVLIPNIDPKYMALKGNNYLYIGQENNLTIYNLNDLNDIKQKMLTDAKDWKQSMIYITDQQDNPESLFISFADKLIRLIYICQEQSLDIPIKYKINDVFLYEDHDIQNFKLLVACEAGIIQVIFDKSLRMPPDIQRAIVLSSAPEKLSKGSNILHQDWLMLQSKYGILINCSALLKSQICILKITLSLFAINSSLRNFQDIYTFIILQLNNYQLVFQLLVK